MASLCEQCVTPKIRSRRFAPYYEFFSDKIKQKIKGTYCALENLKQKIKGTYCALENLPYLL